MPQPRRKLVTLRQHPPDPCERLLLPPPPSSSSPPHGINLLDACFTGELDVRDRDLPVGKEPIQLHRITGRPGGLRPHLPEFNDLPARAHEDRRPHHHHQQQQQQQEQPARLGADMINCGDRSPLLLRTPSLQRLPSAESSYGGSFFSGATGDGNVFSATTATATTSPEGANTSLVVAGTNDDGRPRNWARKAQESYYLQLTLATRLASHAFLADDTYFLHKASPREICGVSSGVETVSYRLWVNGCLSFSDKICDGFYNILGMDPYLWAMCNETEEGRRLPSLGALRQVDPRDSSMEVVLVDKQSDSRLKELKEKALEFSNSLGLTVDLVQKLAKLVSCCMGGAFAMEKGDLYQQWKSCSKTQRRSRQCIVILLGSLSMGLCRHRAILFKALADYIGLSCRIARSCKYCASAHPSSCLVKIEDAKQLPRLLLRAPFS